MQETIRDIEEVVKVVLFRNKELNRRVSALEAEVTEFKAKNATLRERLSRYEKPVKDSHNSSIPPSRRNIKSQAVRPYPFATLLQRASLRRSERS